MQQVNLITPELLDSDYERMSIQTVSGTMNIGKETEITFEQEEAVVVFSNKNVEVHDKEGKMLGTATSVTRYRQSEILNVMTMRKNLIQSL